MLDVELADVLEVELDDVLDVELDDVLDVELDDVLDVELDDVLDVELADVLDVELADVLDELPAPEGPAGSTAATQPSKLPANPITNPKRTQKECSIFTMNSMTFPIDN